MDPIYFQRKGYPQYRFLSNFHEAPQVWHHVSESPAGTVTVSRTFATNEHYYQAMKCYSWQEWFNKIWLAPTPKDAKVLGSQCPMEPGWEKPCQCGCGYLMKEHVMLDGLFMKFEQNPELAKQLLATGDRELIEYAPWGDTYWGVNKDLEGRNLLGKMLMKVRQTLSLR